MVYSAVEEELYINEQNIPVLKVMWQKDVIVQDEGSYEEIISLTTTGYDEYEIDASVNWEQFDTYDLSCGDLLDGLEEQLNDLIQYGTEEEKHIAIQLVNDFAKSPIS